MKTGQRGVNLIRGFESLELEAYQDSAGVWTIGYGHTKDVTPGMRISEIQAESRLLEDILVAEQAVKRHVKVSLKPSQFDALVSFVFNLGEGNFMDSTLLKVVNLEQHYYVPRELTRWVHSSGKPLKGLSRRRAAESVLYLED